MDDANWPTRFKVGVIVGLVLIGSNLWFTVGGIWHTFSTVSSSQGQATPETLSEGVHVVGYGNVALVAGVVILAVTLLLAMRHRCRLRDAETHG